jgi:hypothetical protein
MRPAAYATAGATIGSSLEVAVTSEGAVGGEMDIDGREAVQAAVTDRMSSP